MTKGGSQSRPRSALLLRLLAACVTSAILAIVACVGAQAIFMRLRACHAVVGEEPCAHRRSEPEGRQVGPWSQDSRYATEDCPTEHQPASLYFGSVTLHSYRVLVLLLNA